MPDDLTRVTFSDPRLDGVWREVSALEFATVGGGNHFVELQVDEDGRLWLMVHSGSRAVGPAVRDHHMAQATPVGGGLKSLAAEQGSGTAYLSDARWAQRFASANRQQIALLVEDVVAQAAGGYLQWGDAITTDHNHVELEIHGTQRLWVHRKGAMPAHPNQPGVLPGSMGSLSYHVIGRGCSDALCSSAHGAGRLLSRTEARKSVTERDLRRQMGDVWYDFRQANRLRDEAPSVYKDIRAVVRAEHDLVKVVRVLRPVLNYKGV